MFIERQSSALDIMERFILNLATQQGINDKIRFKLEGIAKDMHRGLLECAFEEIETLPTKLKAKIPASHHALFDARQAYCCAPMNDSQTTENYQAAIDCVINGNNEH